MRVHFGVAGSLSLLLGCFTPVHQQSQTIGPSGGTISSSDGSLVLVVPAGALPGPVVITIASSSSSPLPSTAKGLGTAWALGPAGTTFATPAELTITLPRSQTPSGGSVQIFAAPTGGTAGQALASQVNGPTITAPISSCEIVEAGIIQQPSTTLSTVSSSGSGPTGSTITGTTGVGTLGTGTTGCSGPGTGFTTGESAQAQCTLQTGCQSVTCVGSSCTCMVNGQPTEAVDAGPGSANCYGAWAACGFDTTGGDASVASSAAAGSTGTTTTTTSSNGTTGSGSTSGSTGGGGLCSLCQANSDCGDGRCICDDYWCFCAPVCQSQADCTQGTQCMNEGSPVGSVCIYPDWTSCGGRYTCVPPDAGFTGNSKGVGAYCDTPNQPCAGGGICTYLDSSGPSATFCSIQGCDPTKPSEPQCGEGACCVSPGVCWLDACLIGQKGIACPNP